MSDYIKGVETGLNVALAIVNRNPYATIRTMLEVAREQLEDVAGTIDPDTFAKGLEKRYLSIASFVFADVSMDAIAVNLIQNNTKLCAFEGKITETFGCDETELMEVVDDIKALAFKLAGVPTHFIHDCLTDGAIIDGECQYCIQNQVKNGDVCDLDHDLDEYANLESGDFETILASLKRQRRV